MDSDLLFIKTLDEIKETTISPEAYGVLRSTALLRQMLIDGNRLVDVVNQKRRLKLRFTLSDEWESKLNNVALKTGAIFVGVLDGICPEFKSEETPLLNLSISQFLTFRVIFIRGHFITVHEIIDHCAHVIGGVHIGSPKTEKEALLSNMHDFMIGDLTINLKQVIPILRIVHKGLEPLYNQIKQERGF